MEQLALNLYRCDRREFADFVPRGNEAALAAVRAWAEDGDEPYLFLHGAAGSGKSHLLEAACCAASARGRAALYLTLAHPGLRPEVLDQLETLDVLALDDLTAVVGAADWEQALFSLFDRVRACQRRLLIAASRPPAALPFLRPDLRSRLVSGPGFALRMLDDVGLSELLSRVAAARGFVLDESARRYLLRRGPREPRALLALCARIDDASLAQGRAPTVPFLSQLLGSEDGDGAP